MKRIYDCLTQRAEGEGRATREENANIWLQQKQEQRRSPSL